MVAVAAARLADTALPSAALSGCWRISIKAQYLDTSKGSDVTAATQDLLLHLHQHAASPHIYYHTGKKTEPQRPEVTAKTHKRRRSSVTQSSTFPAPLKLQSGPEGVHYPTYLSWGPFQSSLHLHPHCWRVLPPEPSGNLWHTPPSSGCFESCQRLSSPVTTLTNTQTLKWINTASGSGSNP